MGFLFLQSQAHALRRVGLPYSPLPSNEKTHGAQSMGFLFLQSQVHAAQCVGL
jgi:hypothetical protein